MKTFLGRKINPTKEENLRLYNSILIGIGTNLQNTLGAASKQ